MDIRIISNQHDWNKPLVEATNSQLLQSWQWGVLQQTFDRKAHRLQFVEGQAVVAALQCFEQPLPFGQRYLYAPRGPVFFVDDEVMYDTVMQQLYRAVRTIQTKTPIMFAKIEPVSPGHVKETSVEPLGFRESVAVQPTDELAVQLQHDEEVLLAAMHEKTRYNIRLAERRGVKVRLIEQEHYAKRCFPHLWRLLQTTASRQGIRLHEKQHYARMIELLMPEGLLKLPVAEYKDKIIAAHLLGCFGDTVSYLHGGVDYEERRRMAPHLLHWEGIRVAKNLGAAYYNFGGVAPVSAMGHEWQQLTRFKEGFGTRGETTRRFGYPGAYDLVYQSNWYRLYQWQKQLKRYRRKRKNTS